MERRFTGYEQTFNVGKNVSSGTIRFHGDPDEQNTARPVVYWRVTSWSTPHPVSVKAEYTGGLNFGDGFAADLLQFLQASLLEFLVVAAPLLFVNVGKQFTQRA